MVTAFTVCYVTAVSLTRHTGEYSYDRRFIISASDGSLEVTTDRSPTVTLSDVVGVTQAHEFKTITDVMGMLRGKAILTCANKAFTPLLLNLLYSIQRLRIRRLPYIVIICEDKDAYLEMSKVVGNFTIKILLTLSNLNESLSEATRYKSNDYKSPVRKHVSYIAMLLQNDVDVFYIDSDFVLLADPFPYFNGNFDIFIQSERKVGKEMELCTGFFDIRANTRTMKLVDRWEEWLSKDPAGNQRVFNRLLREMQRKKTLTVRERLRVQVLPIDRFLSGRSFMFSNVPWKEREPRPTEIHANFLKGRDTKVDMLKKNNLWFVE